MSVTEVSTATTSRELLDAVASIRRATRRRVGPMTPGLTESHRELLRLVRTQPGVRVTDAAVDLHLAPNTVSTLVGQLASQQLLERRADPSDGRSSRLHLTPTAARRVALLRDRRASVVDAAIAQLPAADAAAVRRAVPALRRLALVMEAENE
jgi:DNA-binding MarR family transcriptional regulator